MDELLAERLVQGRKELRAHYDRDRVAIADAVAFHMTMSTRELALPSLAVLHDAITKGRRSFDFDGVAEAGTASQMLAVLVTRWKNLPGERDTPAGGRL